MSSSNTKKKTVAAKKVAPLVMNSASPKSSEPSNVTTPTSATNMKPVQNTLRPISPAAALQWQQAATRGSPSPSGYQQLHSNLMEHYQAYLSNQQLYMQQYMTMYQQQQQQYQYQQYYQLQQQQQYLQYIAQSCAMNAEQIARKNLYELKIGFFNHLEELTYLSKGQVFGTYLVNKIGLDDIREQFNRHLEADEKVNNITYSDKEKDTLFFNPEKYLPKLGCRLTLKNDINILMHNIEYFKFFIKLKYYVDTNGYTYQEEFFEHADMTEIGKKPNFFIEEGRVAYNKIVITNLLLDGPITINLYLVEGTNKLVIPKGMFEFEHTYIAKTEKDTYIVHHSTTPIKTLLENIRHIRVSAMPWTPISLVKAKVNSRVSKIDFMVTPHQKTDFWIQYNAGKKPIACKRCLQNVFTGTYATLKCCNTIFHLDCLLDEFDCSTTAACNDCKKPIKDPLCRNAEVLMSLCGYMD